MSCALLGIKKLPGLQKVTFLLGLGPGGLICFTFTLLPGRALSDIF